MQQLPLWPLTVLLAAGALAWNGAAFVGTKPQPRAKDLDFLPTPAVAQALALGQPTAAAKLRWIDSFSYFQLQIERQDDRVAGTDQRGGFERLYETLIALDPLYLPFYEHAATNTGGILKQHRTALGFIQRGLYELPYERTLWRLASAELAVSFKWAECNPVALDGWLRAWEATEPDEVGRQLVRDWRHGLAFTRVAGLETLPYWLEQLHGSSPGTPLGDFVEGTIREMLAQHGVLVLAEVAERRVLPWGPVELDRDKVARRWPRGPESWAPVAADGSLRPDPYGWPWRLSGDRLRSPGQEHANFLKNTRGQRQMVQAEADQRGRAPRDLAEVGTWGVELPVPPGGGVWVFDEHQPAVRWPQPPQSPWKLR